MTALALVITRAGMARFTAAQLGEDIDLTVAEVGFTDQPFVVAPTLETLPHEIRRVASISGAAVGDHIVHMIVRDDDAIGYTATGFGLYLADGTLFGVYGQAGTIVQKSPLTTLLVAIDIAFPTGTTAALTFGDTNFLNPPATTSTPGVLRIAAPAEIVAGTEAAAAATPAAIKRLLPAGAVMMWWGAANAVPAGWAPCDGRTVQRSDGTGQITTPDLRDRVPVGAGGARAPGATFGAAERTADTTEAGAHTPVGHVASGPSGVTLDVASSNGFAGGGSGKGVNAVSLVDPGHAHGIAVDPVPAHRHQVTLDVTQPSLALLFIMRI